MIFWTFDFPPLQIFWAHFVYVSNLILEVCSIFRLLHGKLPSWPNILFRICSKSMQVVSYMQSTKITQLFLFNVYGIAGVLTLTNLKNLLPKRSLCIFCISVSSQNKYIPHKHSRNLRLWNGKKFLQGFDSIFHV